jgi:hypothetical protein
MTSASGVLPVRRIVAKVPVECVPPPFSTFTLTSVLGRTDPALKLWALRAAALKGRHNRGKGDVDHRIGTMGYFRRYGARHGSHIHAYTHVGSTVQP